MKQFMYYVTFGALLLANLSVVIAENESDALWNFADQCNDNEKREIGFRWEYPKEENGEMIVEASLTNERRLQKLHRERGSSYDMVDLPGCHDEMFKSHSKDKKKDKKKDPKKKDPKHKKDPPKKKKNHGPKDMPSKVHRARGPGYSAATMIMTELPEMPPGSSKTYNKDKKKDPKKKKEDKKKDPKKKDPKKDPPKKKKHGPKDTLNKAHHERGPIHNVAPMMAELPETPPGVPKTYSKDKKKGPKKDPKKKKDPKHKKKTVPLRTPTYVKLQRDEQYKWGQGKMVVDGVNVTGNPTNDDSLPELNEDENFDAGGFLHASSA